MKYNNSKNYTSININEKLQQGSKDIFIAKGK